MIALPSDVTEILILNLQCYVAPHVSSPDAVLTVALVNFVLSFLAAEQRALPRLQLERHLALRPVLERVLRKLATAAAGEGCAREIREARRALDAALAHADDPEATNRAVQSALVAERALGHFDAGRDWRREFAVVDTAFVAGLFRECERFYTGEALVDVAETGQRQLTAEMFTAYLRERMPEHAGIEATRLVEIGGGFAKKTYLLDVGRGPRGWEELILRQDVIGGPTPLSVLDEVEIIRLAERSGLPVAHIEWVETEAGRLDAPFVLAPRKRGVSDIAAWQPARDDGSPPGEQLAKHLAHLHRLPTDVAGTGAHSSTRDSLQSFIAGIARRWMRDRPFDDPLVQLGFDWLQDKAPRDVPQLALVHGDLSERNILIDQGKISAILDWELWHVGDPVYDLAYVRPPVEKIMSWDRFLEVYRASGETALQSREPELLADPERVPQRRDARLGTANIRGRAEPQSEDHHARDAQLPGAAHARDAGAAAAAQVARGPLQSSSAKSSVASSLDGGRGTPTGLEPNRGAGAGCRMPSISIVLPAQAPGHARLPRPHSSTGLTQASLPAKRCTRGPNPALAATGQESAARWRLRRRTCPIAR